MVAASDTPMAADFPCPQMAVMVYVPFIVVISEHASKTTNTALAWSIDFVSATNTPTWGVSSSDSCSSCNSCWSDVSVSQQWIQKRDESCCNNTNGYLFEREIVWSCPWLHFFKSFFCFIFFMRSFLCVQRPIYFCNTRGHLDCLCWQFI